MLITSGFNFEGYRIIEYHDHFVAIFPVRTSSVDIKKDSLEIQNQATQQLQELATVSGANALIGFKVELTMIYEYHIIAIAQGTAITIEREETGANILMQKQLPVINFNNDEPIRPCLIDFHQRVSGASDISLLLKCYTEMPDTLTLDVSMDVFTLFGRQISYENQVMRAHKTENDFMAIENHVLDFPYNKYEFDILSYAVVRIQKIYDGKEITVFQHDTARTCPTPRRLPEIKERYGQDAVITPKTLDNGWRCCCGKTNPGNDSCPHCGRTKNHFNFRIAEFLSNARELDSGLPPIFVPSTELVEEAS